ncbi:MAG: response regulator [Cohnella sp.]|nr:response regulator [Cohnella sp.]
MFKLLIVEDEPLIRAGLKHYFSWEELGITDIAEAGNGREGIALALRERPDLIITDIRMPEIDGLDMIGRLSASLPDTVFIILTGYNEFAYAQQAIRLGVVHDFLIKPLIYEESLKTIVSSLDRIRAKREEKDRKVWIEKEVQEKKRHLGAELVKRLVDDAGSIDEDAIREACGFPSDRYAYQCFVLSAVPRSLPWNRSGLRRKMEEAIMDAANTIHSSDRTKQMLYAFEGTKLYAVAVFDRADGPPVTPAAWNRLNADLRDAAFGLPYALYLAVDSMTEDGSSIGDAFRQSEKELNRRFFQPDRYAFGLDSRAAPAPAPKERHFALEDQDKQRLVRNLESGDFAGTAEIMRRLAGEAREKSPTASPDRFLAYVQELVNLTLRFAHKNEIPVNGVYSDKVLSLACVDDFPSIDGLFGWLADWMNHLSEVLQERNGANSHSDHRIFEKIEKYIRDNIDQEITLQTVADRYFYNPSYLSRLFKTKLNKNYMTFITEIRMEYAKQCLMQPKIMVAEVCAMCGYKSYKHFVQTFKRFTNMSPTDFRNRLRL